MGKSRADSHNSQREERREENKMLIINFKTFECLTSEKISFVAAADVGDSLRVGLNFQLFVEFKLKRMQNIYYTKHRD